MWNLDAEKPGVACWSDQHGSWSVHAASGSSQFRIGNGDIHQSPDRASWFSLQPVGVPKLGEVGEQFVRGDELHLHFPQGDALFGFRAVVAPLLSTADTLIVEVTLAIQTDLLDSHPKIDLECDGGTVTSHAVEAISGKSGAPPIMTIAEPPLLAVLLGPHDAPFTTDQSGDDNISLRLFGDFLEKGVIRKARPRIVVSRSGKTLKTSDLVQFWQDLANSPLPLLA